MRWVGKINHIANTTGSIAECNDIMDGILLCLLVLTIMSCNGQQQSCSRTTREHCVYTSSSYYSYHYKPDEMGTLTGDVQNWAMRIQNYILELASEGIKRDFTQSLFDSANYTYEEKDGMDLVQQVRDSLGDYFTKKKEAAKNIAEKVVQYYDNWVKTNQSSETDTLAYLAKEKYKDCDIPSRLPEMEFSPHFMQPVSFKTTTVKISDEVPRNDKKTIDTVSWTYWLEDIFKENYKKDPLIRWQYFGSTAGLVRLFPGREWDTNFAGFYNDYDPRVRPWYIAATSGPKDIVIILDCSLSMKGEKFTIAQAVAKTVINTLTRQDYVNVICARASHWDEVGKWHLYNTDVLSCQRDRLVQATNAHRKNLIEQVYKLKPGGTSELEKGLEDAFDLLQGKTRTACQSLIVFVTDGKDTDGEQVRCGPGYYTRSGYVPGPICKYNWTKMWEVADRRNAHAEPQARIFTFLTQDDGELFPGKLACDHRGSMTKLMSGENLISQMSDYFDFLSLSTTNSQGLWTSPYLDAWGLGLMVTHAVPCISKVDGRTIGVVGIDATLDEIENFLSHHQWGTVYSFLMNKEGETIFHPRLTPSTALVDDPIFIPIEQLEMKGGEPKEFNDVILEMKAGRMGKKRILNARISGKEYINITYYYSGLNDSEYSFAFSLSDTDLEFRRVVEPEDKAPYEKSYFNLIIEYNSSLARKQLPGTFEYLHVKDKEVRYPGLRVSYLHSSIFLAPKCHCDPNAYFYDSDLARKTITAHKFINGITPDVGCEDKNHGKYVKGIRADVLITQPVEKLWRQREFKGINDVKWTYVGMRSGVFRTYPAHRSVRSYDPSQRSWFKRASSTPTKTSISTAYMDAAGVGKIITISQAVWEGMMYRDRDECLKISKVGPWPGGCKCLSDKDCISETCYKSVAPGFYKGSQRCATERVEAVTSLDIMYNRFHNITMNTMEASDGKKSCGSKYECPNGDMDCETRCYLFDNKAKLITDPDFVYASAMDESKYKGLTMGKKEGEVMKDLIYKHGFFRRTETIDFQGVCSITPYAPKVTLDGIPKNPEELDNYYKDKGPIPKFSNNFGCIMDVVAYVANVSALGQSGMITGNVSGPCMSGFYYVTELPKTNLFLLVIENWKQYKDTSFFPFNCKIAQSIVNSGAFQIINGTCAHQDTSTSTLAQEGKCPSLRDIKMQCKYTHASQHKASSILVIILVLIYGYFYGDA